MKNKLLIFLLGLVFIKSLIWLVLTPIFQIPDEPSHFSIVQFIAENGQRPHPRRQVATSKEVLNVAKIVNFNWQIIHPVWQDYQLNWQEKINKLSLEDKTIFLHNRYQTSLKRPPLYYFLAAPFYLVFINQSFLFRFFSVRFLSLIISLFIVYYSYQSAKLIFKSKYLSLATATLVGFQPMLSFIGISAHYDPLAVLITSIFIYSSLIFIKTSQERYFKISLLLAIVGLLIKPDLIVLFLALALLISKKKLKFIIPFSLAGFIFLASFTKLFHQIISTPSQQQYFDKFLYIINLNEYSSHAQFFVELLTSGKVLSSINNYLSANFTANLAQIFPWYWGVFGWLESTLPLWVYRCLKILVLISLTGWLKLFISRSSTLKITSTVKKLLQFSFGFSLVHFAIVILNDFIVFARSGEIFGIQGRYFLPAIIPHMILLSFGWYQLVNKKHHLILSKLIFVFALGFNLIALQTLYQFFGWVWG
ncbi:DUF2142 domain-containing protein [Patescibacteria group bacterium]